MQNTARGQTFFFVDEKSTSKGKRSHVMKHHIREKRSQRPKPSESTVDSSRRTQTPPWKKLAARMVFEAEESAGHKVHSPTARVQEHGHSPANGAESSNGATRSQSAEADKVLEQRMISPTRTDPFETLPVVVTDECQQLMDIWMSKLAYYSGQNMAMKLAVFREAMLHPLSFHVAVLAYTARYHRKVIGSKETPGSRMYEFTAEPLIWNHIQTAQNPADDKLMMAFCGLALQEERFGDPQKAWQHMDRGMEIGKKVLGQRPLHETFLHYVRNTLSPRTPLESPEEALQILAFLRSAEKAMTTSSAASFPNQVPNWVAAFQMGSPLHLLLSSGPNPTSVPDEERIWVVENGALHDTTRTASLICVTVSLLAYSNHPELCARFLSCLQAQVHGRGLDDIPSSESFLWLLLEEPYPPELRDPSRAWSVGDIMSVVSKLPPRLNWLFGELLMRFLMLWKPDLEISVERFEKEMWEFLGVVGVSENAVVAVR